MNVRMCGPFPPEICPFPLKNGGFPTLPPVLPVYPGFSIILSPYIRKAGDLLLSALREAEEHYIQE